MKLHPGNPKRYRVTGLGGAIGLPVSWWEKLAVGQYRQRKIPEKHRGLRSQLWSNRRKLLGLSPAPVEPTPHARKREYEAERRSYERRKITGELPF